MQDQQQKLEVVVDAMAPEDLPRDEGVDVFVHESGYAVTLAAPTAARLVEYLVSYWGDEDWARETVAGAVLVTS